MGLFYSATVGGFVDDRVHRNLPADAVPITAERHAALLAGQRDGRAIEPGPDGRPRNAAAVRETVEQLRTRLVAATKAEAERRILAVAPIWRQLNDAWAMTAPLEDPRRAPAYDRRAAIDAIRTASDALETRIAAAGARALAQLDIHAAGHWPA